MTEEILLEEDGPRRGGALAADLSAYPLLTEQVRIPATPAGYSTGQASDVGSRASQVIQEVLGWRPTRDGRGFSAALSQCFELSVTEGHVVATYRQRGYAARADMGAVTGVQASLVLRARTTVDSVVRPLISALTPLSPTALAEDYEPIRRLVLSGVDDVVAEFAREGGPRLQYLDDVFGQLVGHRVFHVMRRARNEGEENYVALGLIEGRRLQSFLRVRDRGDYVEQQGHLYTLQERMGLNRGRINTVADEKVVSDFLAASDAVFSLLYAYIEVKDELRPQLDRLPGSFEPFLGTQLIHVSRGLAAVAESVNELTFALDSVFIDAVERQTIPLPLTGGTLFLDELLDWVSAVASTQGPQIIQDAGKDGVITLHDTLARLSGLVGESARMASEADNAMGLPRVRVAFEKLHRLLRDVVALTSEITRRRAAERALEDRPASEVVPPAAVTQSDGGDGGSTPPGSAVPGDIHPGGLGNLPRKPPPPPPPTLQRRRR